MRKPLPRYRSTFQPQRRPGAKTSEISQQAVNGDFDDLVWEFIAALDLARRQKHSPHLRASEILEVVLLLGYRKP